MHSLRLWRVGVCLFVGGWLLGMVSPEAAVSPEWKDAFKTFSARLLSPVFQQPEAGIAWELEIKGTVNLRQEGAVKPQSGSLHCLWNDEGKAIIRVDLPMTGELVLASDGTHSWFYVQKHQKTFVDELPITVDVLKHSFVTNAVHYLISMNTSGLAFWPDMLEVGKAEGDKEWSVTSKESGNWIRSTGMLSVLPTFFKWETPHYPGELTVTQWGKSKESFGRLSELLKKYAPTGTLINVGAGQLSKMVEVGLDFAEEKVGSKVAPGLLKNLMRDVPRVDGRPVIVVCGTPEEMGRSYGQQLREATLYNCQKILFGFGLYRAIERGEWFPQELLKTFEKQKPYIPECYVREMNSLAEELGIPSEYVYAANIFPEFFHCSGMALRGSATVGGQLLHGRVLDYMTEIGLQRTAVTVVVIPKGRNAWVNIGYAGCIGSVTCMNEKGLAMGEMGGRGEGYLDGIPMTFLMREVAERFETTEEALKWMEATPRSCEYFYVLSDARTHDAVGIGSWAAALAKERGMSEDLMFLKPGQTHELLPRGIPDACLMGNSRYYTTLADRVEAQHGKITPEIAWNIIGEGVARTSALHIVLFMPDTLDFWTAEASISGKPAYTQPVHKMNLRALMEFTK